MKNEEKKVIVSGMRPTGKIHLGNYHSVLKKWIELQNKYDCFFFIADIHALTTNYDNTENIKNNSINMIIDWLSAGLNHKKCSIFIQSEIKETFELYSILSMITPISWIKRTPSYKDNKNEKLKTHGFLGYPILQGADILILNGDFVPIGYDQIPHLELIGEITKKFNTIYKKNILKSPKPILSNHTKILGIDGKKMSKSNNNTILISDDIVTIKEKIKKTITDPNRIFKKIKGNPKNCTVWSLHKIYSKQEELNYIEKSCKNAEIGCVECKKFLYNKIIEKQIPILNNIKKYKNNDILIKKILDKGAKKATNIAKNTLNKIKLCVKLK